MVSPSMKIGYVRCSIRSAKLHRVITSKICCGLKNAGTRITVYFR